MKNNFCVILEKTPKNFKSFNRDRGIVRSTLTSFYYERYVNPTTKNLLKIADYLGVTLDELLTPEE